MNKILDLILWKKPAFYLLEILKCHGNKEIWTSIISMAIKCNYAHTSHITKKLKCAGLITIKKDGRNKIISLTAYGLKVATLIKKLTED